jgi:hypothetical protein
MRTLATLALVLALSACSRDAAAPEAPDEPDMFTVAGSLTLKDPGGVFYVSDGSTGDSCTGKGGYDDVRRGATVVVRNSRGEKLALGALDVGFLTEDSSEYLPAPCVFDFQVRDVPVDGDLYSIEVAHRGEVNFTSDGAASLTLTLG